MSEVKTLNAYIQLLKPFQQDYIVECVKRFADKPDFHRGLLPFLPADIAANCLRIQLEHMKNNQALTDLDQKGQALLGEKFIRQTISVFAGALIYRLSDDEASEVIFLKSVKLKRHYGPRFGKKFVLTLNELGVSMKDQTKGLIELQMVSRDKWKVTCKSAWLNAVTEHLHDHYS